MNIENQDDTGDQFSLFEAALKNDITDAFVSKLSDMEKCVNAQIEKEEEERILEDIRLDKEKKEKAEKLKLKKEAELKNKLEQDKLDRVLALKSLDEMVRYIILFCYHYNYLKVRELVKECTCPTQFPMVYISDGRYRIGDSKYLIFVRVCLMFIYVDKWSMTRFYEI
jgi:hypothetical protein